MPLAAPGAVYRPASSIVPGPLDHAPARGQRVRDRVAGRVVLDSRELDRPAGGDGRRWGSHLDPPDDGAGVVADLADDGLALGVPDGQSERVQAVPHVQVGQGDRPRGVRTPRGQVPRAPVGGGHDLPGVRQLVRPAIVGHPGREGHGRRGDPGHLGRDDDLRRLAGRVVGDHLGEGPGVDGLAGEQLPGPGREPDIRRRPADRRRDVHREGVRPGVVGATVSVRVTVRTAPS